MELEVLGIVFYSLRRQHLGSGHRGSDAQEQRAEDPLKSAWECPKLNNRPHRETYFSPVKMYECQKGSCIFLNTTCNMQRNKMS